MTGWTPPVYPWPIGVGARYHPSAASAPRLRCSSGREFAVHLELFANRRVVIVPAGIGKPHACVRTVDPTGVLLVRGNRTVGDLFRIWRRALGADRLLSFRGRVAVFVGGLRFRGRPGDAPLARHANVVVEIGGYVKPHAHYTFMRGR